MQKERFALDPMVYVQMYPAGLLQQVELAAIVTYSQRTMAQLARSDQETQSLHEAWITSVHSDRFLKSFLGRKIKDSAELVDQVCCFVVEQPDSLDLGAVSILLAEDCHK